jgi:hypothetical protein
MLEMQEKNLCQKNRGAISKNVEWLKEA